MARNKDTYNSYMKDYMRMRYARLRLETIKAMGGKCVQCGSVDDLQIDHKDPATKEFPVSKFWSLSRQKLQKELNKCQLLCEKCHAEKTRKDGSSFKNQPNGSACSWSKLNEYSVLAIRTRLEGGTKISELAKQYGVCRGTIASIKNRVTWKDI